MSLWYTLSQRIFFLKR